MAPSNPFEALALSGERDPAALAKTTASRQRRFARERAATAVASDGLAAIRTAGDALVKRDASGAAAAAAAVVEPSGGAADACAELFWGQQEDAGWGDDGAAFGGSGEAAWDWTSGDGGWGGTEDAGWGSPTSAAVSVWGAHAWADGGSSAGSSPRAAAVAPAASGGAAGYAAAAALRPSPLQRAAPRAAPAPARVGGGFSGAAAEEFPPLPPPRPAAQAAANPPWQAVPRRGPGLPRAAAAAAAAAARRGGASAAAAGVRVVRTSGAAPGFEHLSASVPAASAAAAEDLHAELLLEGLVPLQRNSGYTGDAREQQYDADEALARTLHLAELQAAAAAGAGGADGDYYSSASAAAEWGGGGGGGGSARGGRDAASQETLLAMMAKAARKKARAADGCGGGGGGGGAEEEEEAEEYAGGKAAYGREWHTLFRSMRDAGWCPVATAGRGGGHLKFERTLPVSGRRQVVTMASTPSDAIRGVKNTAGELRRLDREASEFEAAALEQQELAAAAAAGSKPLNRLKR